MNWIKVGTLRDSVYGINKPPEGSFTAAEYMNQFGISDGQSRKEIARLLHAGKLKKTMVKINSSWVPHYTVVESTQEPDHATTKRTNGRRGRRFIGR